MVDLAGEDELKERLAAGLCLSYPLRRAKDESDTRDTNFASVLSPMLFASGTRDPLCHRPLMKRAIKAIPTKVEMIWIDTADHSGMPKRQRPEAFEVPDYFHTIVSWACELSKLTFDPELATNNEPEAKPVAAILAKRRRDVGDDPRAKRQFDAIVPIVRRSARLVPK